MFMIKNAIFEIFLFTLDFHRRVREGLHSDNTQGDVFLGRRERGCQIKYPETDIFQYLSSVGYNYFKKIKSNTRALINSSIRVL